jgi:hypothetical protein
MPKEVITFLPDAEYTDLYKLVKKKGRYSETFWPDKVETQMWINNGKLMSQLKGDLRIKQILPTSKMNEYVGDSYKSASGFALSVSYIQEKFGMPISVASQLMIDIYKQHGIPKEVSIPYEILEKIQICQVPKPSFNTVPQESEGPEDSTELQSEEH